MLAYDLILLHVSINKIILHVDINNLNVNINMLHVDVVYLACRGQKCIYATRYM